MMRALVIARGIPVLSRDDIIRAIRDGSLEVYPLDPRNLTGIGFNLSTTYFVFSLTKGALLPVLEEITTQGKEHCVYVPAGDTVLLFSREYIAVDNTIAGTFHSKVSCVCQGFGHVSTTLDPTWQGQLILSLNNPTKKAIKLNLDKPGNIVTMLLYALDTPVTGPDIHDNNRGRCDLLLNRFAEPPEGSGYKEKFLELREFVVDKYADSLNGNDSFLGDGRDPDRYSKTEANLKRMKDRLSQELSFLANGDYLSSERVSITPIPFKEERDLISSCSYVRVCKKCDEFDLDDLCKPVPIFSKDSAETAQKMVSACIRAIDYELNTIDHLRRVEWQNASVLTFAAADSELAVAQRRNREDKAKREMLGKVIGAAIGDAVLLAIIIAFAAGLAPFSPEIQAVIVGSLASLFFMIGKYGLSHLSKWLEERSLE